MACADDACGGKCSWRCVAAVVVVAAAAVCGIVFLVLYLVRPNFPKNSHSAYQEFNSSAVATDAGPCSTIGKELLLKGGSVVDAGIGAMLCVGLYNAHSTGIGGGSFMTIYDAPTKRAVFINAREVAMNARKDAIEKNNATKEGASVIAVPGEIAGYWKAHKMYGKLEWRELFEPTIKLAEEGYKVNYALARAIDKQAEEIRHIDNNLNLVFMNADGTLKKENDTVKMPDLAKTLERIASEGASAFYNGILVQDIVNDLRDAPGVVPGIQITEEDLKSYRAEIGTVINITIGDLMLYTPGAPSGGPMLCYILNILKGYHFNPISIGDSEAMGLTYHRIAEAFKFASFRRGDLGDERFNSTITEVVKTLTDVTYAEATRREINDSATRENYGPVKLVPEEDTGTTHLSIVGPDGSAIAITSTINDYFGSKVRGKRTGIIFNNAMTEFESRSIANSFKPGKRPRSSMTPTIIIERTRNPKEPPTEKVRIVAGAAGGGRIVSGTALTLMNMLWFGKDVEEAVDMKRIHAEPSGEKFKIRYEEGLSEEVVEGLRKRGQNVLPFVNNPMSSVVQVVRRLSSGKLGAMSDKRKRGYPDGYY